LSWRGYRKLISYDHRLDFDAEYPGELDKLLTDFGQPRRTYMKRDPWTGPGGGYLKGASANYCLGDWLNKWWKDMLKQAEAIE
jgi:hypothetical protein